MSCENDYRDCLCVDCVYEGTKANVVGSLALITWASLNALGPDETLKLFLDAATELSDNLDEYRLVWEVANATKPIH